MAVSVLGVAHANVNCTSLERSLAFYQGVLGLAPLIHTAAAPQDGAGFGLDGDVAWDAWMMTDAGGMTSTAIDLLEWRTPRPAGRPYGDPRHRGFSRLRIGVEDAGRVARLAGDGGRAHTTAPRPRRAESPRAAAALCRDPDGTLIELVDAPATRLLAVTAGCAELARSLPWYERVLGLEVAPGDAVDPSVLGLAADATSESRLLRPGGQPDGFALELTQWHGAPPPEPPYPAANHTGIYRVAFLVADARAAHAELQRLGVACPPAVFLDLGPEVPIAGVWAVFFRDPDGACLELIEVPAS